MSSPSYSLTVKFPDNSLTPDGTYDVTLYAKIDGDKVADVCRTPAERQTFLTTVGCPIENPTSASKSTTMASLGESEEPKPWFSSTSLPSSNVDVNFGLVAVTAFALGFALRGGGNYQPFVPSLRRFDDTSALENFGIVNHRDTANKSYGSVL